MIHNFAKCVPLLFSLHIVVLSTSAEEQYRPSYFVVGGSLVDSYDFAKYAVSIQLDLPNQMFGVGHFGGGSIIAKNKILTAAHCLMVTEEELRSIEELVVVVGIRDRFERTNFTQVHEVAKLVPHKGYSKHEHIINDIGIVILKDEIQFNSPDISKIRLAVSRPRRNQLCTVIGWGRIYSEGPISAEVQFAEVNILGRGECYSRLNGAMHSAGQMCVGDAPDWRAGSCQGDSGRPLICNRKLAGIVSAGIGCAEKYMPGIYTDVYYYRDWINFGGLKTCQYRWVCVVCLIHFVPWN